jgi:T-complex protein 1 subunit beta
MCCNTSSPVFMLFVLYMLYIKCKHAGVALGEACTIVLRGASSHILEEADRSLHDALCVLSETVKEPRVLYGGGWPEMRMARAIEEAAKKTPGTAGCK